MKLTAREIEAAAMLKRIGITPPAPGQPWPKWTDVIAARRQPGDRGIGDTAAGILDRFGAGIMKRAYKAAFGQECACSDRQERLNAWFPYKPPALDTVTGDPPAAGS